MEKATFMSVAPEFREIKKQPGHGFFFAGVGGTNANLRAVQGILEKKFGIGNATTYNSAFLTGKPAADRFEEMGATIKEKLQTGPVTILAHSYGAVEVLRALTQDESILADPQNRDKIKMIFISPVIPEGWLDIAKKLLTFGKLNIQEGRMLGFVFPGKSSVVSSIVSANSLTTDVMSRQEWDEVVSLASPKLSNQPQGMHTLGDYPKRDYLHLHDEDTQESLNLLDKRIKAAKDTGKKWATRRALQRRGHIRRKIVPLYAGDYSDDFRDPTVTPLKEGSRQETRHLRRRLITDAGQGRERMRFEEVKEQGVEMWRVDPKQDLMHSGRRAARNLQVPADRIVVSPFTTHATPWSAQIGILSAIIDACNNVQ